MIFNLLKFNAIWTVYNEKKFSGFYINKLICAKTIFVTAKIFYPHILHFSDADNFEESIDSILIAR